MLDFGRFDERCPRQEKLTVKGWRFLTLIEGVRQLSSSMRRTHVRRWPSDRRYSIHLPFRPRYRLASTFFFDKFDCVQISRKNGL